MLTELCGCFITICYGSHWNLRLIMIIDGLLRIIYTLFITMSMERYSMDNEVVNVWSSFKNEIKNINRYFFDRSIVELLSEIQDIKMFPNDTKLEFFRARKGSFSTMDVAQMMNPPRDLAHSGRCNPEGVSYLYLATNEETAIKEIRVCNQQVTIAKFEVDVSNVFSFLPYNFSYMKEYMFSDKVKTLIEIINLEMGKSIDEDKQVDYIPLQFISEYIKYIGYDGFMYKSVVGDGINLVMFNSDKVTIKERYEKTIC